MGYQRPRRAPGLWDTAGNQIADFSEVAVAATAPGRPTGLQVATQPGSLDVAVDWDDVDGATSYLVRWRGAGPENDLNEGVEAQSSETTITVSGYRQWVVQVEACNNASCGLGVARTVDVEQLPPGRPENFTVSTTPDSLSLSATWDPVAGASTYKLQWRRPDGGFGDNQVIATDAGASITVSDYGQWVVRVEACNDAGCGPGVAQTVDVEGTPPGQAENFAVSSTPGELSLSATWDPVDGASSYKLRWRRPDGGFGNNQAIATGAGASITVSGYGQWVVRVRACNDAGCGHPVARHLTVEDVAPEPPTLSVADARAGEGGALRFAVRLSEAGDSAVTVDYATSDGTAAAGQDYTAASGTLTFAPGELEQTIEVAALADRADEGDETFTVSLSNLSGATLADGEATGTVENVAPEPLTLSVADARAGEGGALRFAVRLSEAGDSAVTVDYATADGTAAAGDDYTAASGTLTLAAGVLEQTIEVTALTDRAGEGDETFTVTLSNPSGATLADGEATGTVENVAPEPPTLSVADARAGEGGALRFAVRLSEAGDAAVTVDYATSDGTAAAGDDYTAASGTLTFAPGELEQTIEVAALADRAEEGDETFAVTLSNPSGATLADGEATGTVENVAPEPEGNVPPVFNPGSYSFSIAESAKVWNSVGSVAATDQDSGDTVTYHITAGNGAGRFIIDLNFGEILVWGALDHETVSSYTLTVEARDGNGGTATATVEINVTDVAE